jgi:hypothetical protein
MPGKKTGLSKEVAFSLTLVLWAAAAWALYPLVDIDNVDMGNVKTYLYRSAMGVTILVIFFGKTLHDLIFPWVTSRTIPRWNAILLTLYLVLLSGGIVFVVVRMAVLLAKNRQRQGFLF